MENIIKCLDRNDLIIIMANVIFFMVIQTLFFIYEASKQYESVLADKMDVIKSYAARDENVRNYINQVKNSYISQNMEKAKEQYNKRYSKNKKLIFYFCGIPIIIASLYMLYLVFISENKKGWHDVDTLGLIFVLLAYTTELFFFYFVVRKYEFVGDTHIMATIANNIQ